jgi:hypothetical protein
MDPVVELLDRQVDFLLGQEHEIDFLVQVEPFLAALRSEPRLAVHFDDFEQEMLNDIRVLEQIDAEIAAELVDLRKELVELLPALDDADTVRSGGDAPDFSYEFTLAFFDEQAATEPPPFNHKGEGGLAGTLSRILQSKDAVHLRAQEEAAQAAGKSGALGKDEDEAVEAWRFKLGNLDRRQKHAARWLQLRMRTSAGLALLRLDQVPGELNPEPEQMATMEDARAFAESMLVGMHAFVRPLFKLVAGERLDDFEQRGAAEQVDELRVGVKRLHQELRHRIGTVRSRLALVQRFKLRCQGHDSERLAGLADDKSLPGKPEDRLTAEFARYLFDEGLSPLTRPLIAGLEPDLLDPQASFYVEAKQYKRSARRELVRSVGQVLDTVGRLQGSPYEVHEAFVVVFRRGGPRYILPPVLDAESYRVHLVLVDIGSLDESGARQRQRPVVLSADEFFAAADEADARQAGAGATGR